VPGAIATDFGGGLVRDNQYVNAIVAGAIALGRVGQPDDIGAAVPAIVSAASRECGSSRSRLTACTTAIEHPPAGPGWRCASGPARHLRTPRR